MTQDILSIKVTRPDGTVVEDFIGSTLGHSAMPQISHDGRLWLSAALPVLPPYNIQVQILQPNPPPVVNDQGKPA